MKFGAPTHRLNEIMMAVRQALEIPANFIFFPSSMVANFGETDTCNSIVNITKISSALDLGRLATTHAIYKEITHHEIGAEEGSRRLAELLDPAFKPVYPKWLRCFFGFIKSFILCGLAFNGTLLDSAVAGGCGAMINWMQLTASGSSIVYSTFYE